jgi:CheY-like chemotaxis protein
MTRKKERERGRGRNSTLIANNLDLKYPGWGIHPLSSPGSMPHFNLRVLQHKIPMERRFILIAEDNEDEVLLIRRAFRNANVINPLFFVRNGEEVIEYLKGEGRFSNREEYPVPDLLLLDLKMPKVDGFEVLHWVRYQPQLKALRIVVLTNSSDVRDVNRAYRLGANSFLVKPVDFGQFVELSSAILGYWLWLSKVPEVSRSDESSAHNVPFH